MTVDKALVLSAIQIPGAHTKSQAWWHTGGIAAGLQPLELGGCLDKLDEVSRPVSNER